MRAPRPAFALFYASTALACGGQTTQVATDTHFRAILRHEATIDAEAQGISTEDCEERASSIDATCDASARICQIHEEVQDHDTEARCEDAQRRCAAAESRRCGNEDDDG